MKAKRSVLIVDPSPETREVLETALQRHGVETYSAQGTREGLVLADTHQPDLIVLDLEVEAGTPDEVLAPFVTRTSTESTRLVVLGAARRRQTTHYEGEVVAKPYHYGPLVRRIEALLNGKETAPAADE